MTTHNTDHKGQASPRWAFMQPFDIYAKDGSGDVYLHRLRIVQTPFFAVYLHDINLPDTDRDPHDHPWTFISIVLRGSYTEKVWERSQYAQIEALRGLRAFRRRHLRWTAHLMTREKAHMIEHVEKGTKTLILTGPRRKGWGFHTLNGYVPWQEYLDV